MTSKGTFRCTKQHQEWVNKAACYFQYSESDRLVNNEYLVYVPSSRGVEKIETLLLKILRSGELSFECSVSYSK